MAELERGVDVEVDDGAQRPLLVLLLPGVADARRHAVVGIGQVARAAGELVLPHDRRVDGVEHVGAVAVAGEPGLLGEDVGVRLNHVPPCFVDPARAASGERHAALEDGAVERARVHRGAPSGEVVLAGLVPERAVVSDARRDGQEVVQRAERSGQAVVGVEAERLVVGPRARIVREGVLVVAVAVLGIAAAQIAYAVLGLVVDGQAEDRERGDVEEHLGKAAGAAVEVVERARDADARGERALEVLPRHLVAFVREPLVLEAEERLAEEVLAHV